MAHYSPAKRYRLILALICLCLLSACGQKGDLYLPDNKPQVAIAPLASL